MLNTINIIISSLPVPRPKVETPWLVFKWKIPNNFSFFSYVESILKSFLWKNLLPQFQRSVCPLIHLQTSIWCKHWKPKPWINLILFCLCLLPLVFLSLPLFSLHSTHVFPPWWQILLQSPRQGTSIQTVKGNVEILSCPVNSSGMKSRWIVLAVILK